ncbi:MAG: ATP-binding cassette domain-containing protein [Planctomycetota bacterium]|nr:ATP-binding cassette domain-containing protein [Planctomycetota bacterium]
MSDAVVLIDVRKSFGSVRAVAGVDFRLARGEVCGFLGPNGAGKSTLIRMIMAIIRQDSGELTVLDGDPVDVKDRVGYLPEERGLYRKMKVGTFLSYIGRLKGLTARDARRRAGEALERLELPGILDRRCSDLSKGQQQKVQFVSSILHEPELLVLDEPFSGLDPVNRRTLQVEIESLRQRGKTIIFSTHQMEQAERLCDRVILVHHGRKLLDASLADALRSPGVHAIEAEPLGALDEARRALIALPCVKHAAVSEESRTIRLDISPEIALREAMIQALECTPLTSVRESRATLDDVFVHLVDQGNPTVSEVAHG